MSSPRRQYVASRDRAFPTAGAVRVTAAPNPVAIIAAISIIRHHGTG